MCSLSITRFWLWAASEKTSKQSFYQQLFHCWNKGICCQCRFREDQPFTHLLNRFRTASQTEADIQCIQLRSLNPIEPNYPKDALHIFAKNAPVDQHNNEHLQCLSTPPQRLKATDQYPPNVNKQDIDRVLARGRSETGALLHAESKS